MSNVKMTCQICGRLIGAKQGLIAHHGYTRPGCGWLNGGCPGERYLPFEVTRMNLDAHIGKMYGRLNYLKEQKTTIENPATAKVFMDVYGHENGTSYTTVDAKNFENQAKIYPKTFSVRRFNNFEAVRKYGLVRNEHDQKIVQEQINFQKKRYDSWQQTHFRKDGVWMPLTARSA